MTATVQSPELLPTKRKSEPYRQYLDAVLTVTSDAIVVLDAQQRVLEWNPSAERLFGYSKEEVIGQHFDMLLTNAEPLGETATFAQIANRSAPLPPEEAVCRRKDGACINVIVTGSPILSEDKFSGIVLVYIDNARRKEDDEPLPAFAAELELRVAERTAELAQKNEELTREIDERAGAEAELLRRNRELLSLQAAATATTSSLDVHFVLETVTWEMTNLLEVEGCAIYGWDQQVDTLPLLVEYGADGWNEQEHTQSVFQLKDSPLRQRVLAERFGQQMLVSQPGADAAERAYMKKVGLKTLLILPMVFQDRAVGLVEIKDSQVERTFTDREISLAQWLATEAASAVENAQLYEQARQEISERVLAEERVKASLKEKEVLLKEIHHRVKNNLQIISSLLYLQSKTVSDPEILEMFEDSRNRIKSMALIHEELYRAQDLARIDFTGYIHTLGTNLIRSYGTTSNPVSLHVNADDVVLSVDTAVPCGLIVNELVSNSLKHAFPVRTGIPGEDDDPSSRNNVIHIQVQPEDANHLMLIVGDNGVGFPDDLDFRNTESLGLKLVNTLVRQLSGTIELGCDDGTEFRIMFSVA